MPKLREARDFVEGYIWRLGICYARRFTRSMGRRRQLATLCSTAIKYNGAQGGLATL